MGSAEIQYWMSELSLRAREEREAMEAAKAQAEGRPQIPKEMLTMRCGPQGG